MPPEQKDRQQRSGADGQRQRIRVAGPQGQTELPGLVHGDRELAGPVIAFACTNVLSGTHDVDAVGCRYRGHEREFAAGLRVHSAFKGSVVKFLLVPLVQQDFRQVLGGH